ncbi:hypothetical protein SAMN05428949_1618 [Chitinophaga sp. YR627]|uniref:hypothetical protein n=1 Tax=Chitinophaga sp. YR627 TaxID=1881041 RepID=UPI0008EF93EE|nr:hypothetical protein [Chitinophaga sp. YR627]SFM99406.1 hypothetical protein SAMN05428949_1618 [Chitinophaga sp. YR627]
MEKFSVLLCLTAFICLIIGLIKPSAFKGLFKAKTSRKTVSLTFAGIMLASFILFAIVVKPLTAEEKAKAKLEDAAKNTDKPAVTETAAPAKPQEAEQSPEEKIKTVIREELKGENNNDKPYLRDINVAMENQAAAVTINFNANDNLTTNMIRSGIKSKMSDLYLKLYKSNLPIKSVSVCAYMPMSDKYGNQSDDIVYTSILESEEAAKVNWSAEDYAIKSTVLPNVWTTLFLHPALKSE